jgi:hypothetical protein
MSRRFLHVLGVMLALAGAVRAAGAQDAPLEYRARAAFIFQFPHFVDWPQAATDGRTSIQICVLTPSPLAAVLTTFVKGESVRGRSLTVRSLTGVEPIDTCHVLVLTTSGEAASTLLKMAAPRPILTVGERDGFLEDGGIIRLRVISGHLRFEISAANAQRAGLRLGSQMLSLAVTVQGAP